MSDIPIEGNHPVTVNVPGATRTDAVAALLHVLYRGDPDTNWIERLAEHAPPVRYRFGKFVLHALGGVLTRDGQRVMLTAQQFDLLHVLAARPQQVLSRQEIRRLLNKADEPIGGGVDRLVDQIVSRIHRRMRDHIITTVSGKGYALRQEVTVEYDRN